MQDNDTKLPDNIQDWATSEKGRATIDHSVARMRRDSARNGNGEPGHAEDLPEFSPWQLKTLAELEDEPLEDGPWLVAKLLPANGLSLLAGAPKAGKSTLARNLAVEVARGGGKWLGKDVNQGTVLHLSLEERIQTIRNHYNQLDAPGEQIYLLTKTHPRPKNFILWLQSAIAKYKPSLVIIDPAIRFLKIRDMNDYALTTEALDPLINLAREFNTHILLVHHTRKCGGKYGNEILGSTGLAASVDTIVTLDIKDDQRMFYAYGRDNVDIEMKMLNMDDNGRIDVGDTKREADEDDIRYKAIKYLRETGEPQSTDQIREALGCRKQILTTALKHAVKDGDIKYNKEGNRKLYQV